MFWLDRGRRVQCYGVIRTFGGMRHEGSGAWSEETGVISQV